MHLDYSQRQDKNHDSDAAALDKSVTGIVLKDAVKGDAVGQNKTCYACDSANDVGVHCNHLRRIVV
jgi:hypothetical protein